MINGRVDFKLEHKVYEMGEPISSSKSSEEDELPVVTVKKQQHGISPEKPAIDKIEVPQKCKVCGHEKIEKEGLCYRCLFLLTFTFKGNLKELTRWRRQKLKSKERLKEISKKSSPKTGVVAKCAECQREKKITAYGLCAMCSSILRGCAYDWKKMHKIRLEKEREGATVFYWKMVNIRGASVIVGINKEGNAVAKVLKER